MLILYIFGKCNIPMKQNVRLSFYLKKMYTYMLHNMYNVKCTYEIEIIEYSGMCSMCNQIISIHIGDLKDTFTLPLDVNCPCLYSHYKIIHT